MKFKKIVGFGDSFMWGDELLDPALQDLPDAHSVHDLNVEYRENNCFLGQLGKHYGLAVENFGIPGGSLQSTLWNYIWWTQHTQDQIKDCLVLVAHTNAWRQSFYNPGHVSYGKDPSWNRYVHNAWVVSDLNLYDQQWTRTVKDLFTLTNCTDLQVLNYLQSTMFFEGQSSLNNDNIIQFCSLDPPMVSPAQNLVWSDSSLRSILSQRPNSEELLAKRKHPNELGHKLIAQLLIDHIDSCYNYA